MRAHKIGTAIGAGVSLNGFLAIYLINLLNQLIPWCVNTKWQELNGMKTESVPHLEYASFSYLLQPLSKLLTVV